MGWHFIHPIRSTEKLVLKNIVKTGQSPFYGMCITKNAIMIVQLMRYTLHITEHKPSPDNGTSRRSVVALLFHPKQPPLPHNTPEQHRTVPDKVQYSYNTIVLAIE